MRHAALITVNENKTRITAHMYGCEASVPYYASFTEEVNIQAALDELVTALSMTAYLDAAQKLRKGYYSLSRLTVLDGQNDAFVAVLTGRYDG